MKKIKLKIMSLAMVSLLGMSFLGQLNASAMLRSSGKGSIVVDMAAPAAESREELIRQLPWLWLKFWAAVGASKSAARELSEVGAEGQDVSIIGVGRALGRVAAIDIVLDTLKAAKDGTVASIDATSRAAGDAAFAVAWEEGKIDRDAGKTGYAAFADAWLPGGVAYTVVKDNEIGYFRELKEALEKQTQKLHGIVKKENEDKQRLEGVLCRT